MALTNTVVSSVVTGTGSGTCSLDFPGLKETPGDGEGESGHSSVLLPILTYNTQGIQYINIHIQNIINSIFMLYMYVSVILKK